MGVSNERAKVEAIYISPVASQLPVSVATVEAVAGLGLVGDRYFKGEGTWSHWSDTGREVTLIAVEALEALPENVSITAAEARRNLLVRCVELDTLVGRDFRVGDVIFRGQSLCEPCAYLESLTFPGVLANLQGIGGLRADIVVGGFIHRGDLVSPV